MIGTVPGIEKHYTHKINITFLETVVSVGFVKLIMRIVDDIIFGDHSVHVLSQWVTSSLIGWVHTQNYPWIYMHAVEYHYNMVQYNITYILYITALTEAEYTQNLNPEKTPHIYGASYGVFYCEDFFFRKPITF